MKVMVIVKASKDSEAGLMPSEELLREMGNFNEALVAAGLLLSGEGLHPSSRGVRVRFSGKDRTVVNGPFAETKELIAGYWVWQVKSMDEAIEWVKRCPNPMLGDSEIEVRRIFASEDFAASDPTGEVRAQEQRLLEKIQSNQQLAAPRFEQGRAMILAGLSRNYNTATRPEIPQLWMKFGPYLGDVPGQLGKDAFGVCFNEAPAGAFDYLASVEVKDTSNLLSGFTVLRIPTQRYAVFTHSKHVSHICDTFDAIFQQWLPASGLEIAKAPYFEKYTEAFCPDVGVGGIEIWIPIKS